MCTAKKIVASEPVASSTVQNVKTPTYADASVTKASDNQRSRIAGLHAKNIKTTARGLVDEPTTNKRKLLGE